MKPEVAKIVETELKNFGTRLNLSEDQKSQLSTFLENARAKIDEYRQQHPDATPADIVAKIKENRASLRERLEKFLKPDQLKIWDEEMAKAKTFLGENLG
jgi:hypothetical protein